MTKLVFQLLIFIYLLIIIIDGQRPEECELPYETGPCRALLPSFYFNPQTNRCEEFIYGGCHGNANRFATEEDCLTKCGKEDDKIIHEDQ